MTRAWVRSVAGYALAVGLCLGFLVIVLQLWKADLRVPFLYWEDALLVDSWVKGVLDNGWYLHNAYLGAPAAQDFHDFLWPKTCIFCSSSSWDWFARLTAWF